MPTLTNQQLHGHYGAFSVMKWRRYQAIAIGRILEFRTGKTPRGFNELLSQVSKFGNEGYDRRNHLLTYFGINTYAQYLESELWSAIRILALRRDETRCRFCRGNATQVHHVSYDIATLSGSVLGDNLLSTCRDCHQYVEFNQFNGRKLPFREVVARTKSLLKRGRW